MRLMGSLLDQFQKYSVCRGGMNECYQRAARAHTRLLVNQARASLTQACERRMYVVYAHGYVVKAGAALLQKFCYGRIVARRLKKLYAGLTEAQHGHPHALAFYLFHVNYLKPQRLAPEPQRLLNLPRSNT